jgi:hypothetical protein
VEALQEAVRVQVVVELAVFLPLLVQQLLVLNVCLNSLIEFFA